MQRKRPPKSILSQKLTSAQANRMSAKGAGRQYQDISFGQFVRTGKERRWKIEANALGSLEINNKVEVSGRFER
jgi:hypothetical protein